MPSIVHVSLALNPKTFIQKRLQLNTPIPSSVKVSAFANPGRAAVSADLARDEISWSGV